jgi:ActR/RegA family two-component response regulator
MFTAHEAHRKDAPEDMEQLQGKVILVVEDNFFIATEMRRSLATAGAQVLGPVGRIDDALALIARTDCIDGAVVDLNLHGDMAFPVADALVQRCVPFMFVTGYDQGAIPERYRKVPRYQKLDALQDAFKALFN